MSEGLIEKCTEAKVVSQEVVQHSNGYGHKRPSEGSDERGFFSNHKYIRIICGINIKNQLFFLGNEVGDFSVISGLKG
jgi:hypothetical protein